MSNLNVAHESTVSDHSKTGFIFDIAPLLKKREQNNSSKLHTFFGIRLRRKST